MAFDAKKFTQLDWAIVGGAGVAFISGFLPWWGYDAPRILGRSFSASISGWSTGFTGWFGLILLTLAGVFLVLRRSEVSLPALPVGPSVVVAGLAALGLLLVVIRWLTIPRVGSGFSGHYGAKWGIWVAMIAGAVEVVAAVMELRASGEPLPWAQPKPSAGS